MEKKGWNVAKLLEFTSNGKFFVMVDDYNIKIHPKGIMNFLNKSETREKNQFQLKTLQQSSSLNRK